LSAPIGSAFTAILPKYKGLVDVAKFGLPENFCRVGDFLRDLVYCGRLWGVRVKPPFETSAPRSSTHTLDGDKTN
jgi:hypothetical protein